MHFTDNDTRTLLFWNTVVYGRDLQFKFIRKIYLGIADLSMFLRNGTPLWPLMAFRRQLEREGDAIT